MNDQKSIQDIARGIVALGTPTEQVEAFVARGTDTQILVREQTVESLTRSESSGVGVRVLRDGRCGFAYVSSLDHLSVADAVDQARANSAHTTTHEEFWLPEPDGVPPPALDLWRSNAVTTSLLTKIELATELEALVAQAGVVDRVKSVRWGDATAESAIVSTSGISSYSRRTSCFLSTYVISQNRDGSTSTFTGYTVGREPDDLYPDEAARNAISGVSSGLHSVLPRMDAGTVVFTPSVTSVFLAFVLGAVNSTSPQQAQSFRPGNRLGSRLLNIMDDPTDPTSFGASAYDAEGIATRANGVISEGIVRQRLHNSETARLENVRTNGCAIRAGYKSLPTRGARAIQVTGGQHSPEEMIADTSHGVLVQSIAGLQGGANMATGDFSISFSGRLIRNGELAEHVAHSVLASNLAMILSNLAAVGTDHTVFPGVATGVSLSFENIQLGI